MGAGVATPLCKPNQASQNLIPYGYCGRTCQHSKWKRRSRRRSSQERQRRRGEWGPKKGQGMLSRYQHKQCNQRANASKVQTRQEAKGPQERPRQTAPEGGKPADAKTSSMETGHFHNHRTVRRSQLGPEGAQMGNRSVGTQNPRGNESEVQSARLHWRRWSTVKEECAIPVSQKICSH